MSRADHKAFRSGASVCRFFFCLLLGLGLAGCVTYRPSAESHGKAMYLFRFTQFVEWPPVTFPDTNAPIVIGLLGGNPFGSDLGNIVKGQAVNGHPIEIRRLNPLSDPKKCQVLYVDRHISCHFPLIFAALAGGHTLTVSDADRFVKTGGMVYFFTEGDKVRFEINRPVVEKAGLKMNSQLLMMARHPRVER